MSHLSRETSHLRRGRISVPGARYFLTCCTKDRKPALSDPVTLNQVCAAWSALHEAHDIELLCATVMPDHVHALLILGDQLDLSRLIAKVKALARRGGDPPWRWQENGFEHGLRPSESIEDYGFYIFMNPYQSGLLVLEQNAPAWICPEEKKFRFLKRWSEPGAVPEAWLKESGEISERISVGSGEAKS